MAEESSPLHPDVREFITCMRRIEGLLTEDGEQFWLKRIRNVIHLAQKSDGYSVVLYLGMIGGMGSFKDLVLNGSRAANSALAAVRTHAYDLAKKLS